MPIVVQIPKPAKQSTDENREPEVVEAEKMALPQTLVRIPIQTPPADVEVEAEAAQAHGGGGESATAAAD